MSDVTPINGVSSPALSSHARSTYHEPVKELSPIRSGDKVEISRAAQYLSQLLSQPEIRTDLVDRVKAQIADGTYETPDKLDAAFEEMLTDLA